MTTTLDAALARLRNADPAAAMPVDTVGTDPHAVATLAQILGSAGDRSVAEPRIWARRRRLRRLALAGAFAAAVAVTAVAGVIPMPWSHGQTSWAAYAITRNPDGTVEVTVRWNQLHNPDALNARLRQAGVRAAVMLYAAPGQCRTPVVSDPAYTSLRLEVRQHPELANDPRALAAYLRSLTPWIDHARQSGRREGVAVFTIHPDAIPSGDQLLVLPQWGRPQGATTDDTLQLRWLLVPTLPPCVPSPEDSILTRNGIDFAKKPRR